MLSNIMVNACCDDLNIRQQHQKGRAQVPRGPLAPQRSGHDGELGRHSAANAAFRVGGKR